MNKLFIGRKRIDDIDVIHELKKASYCQPFEFPLLDLNQRPSD